MSTDFTFNRFAKNWLIFTFAFSLLYWLWFGCVVGVTAMEVAFFILIMGLIFGNHTSRRLAIAFSPFFFYLICYGSLKILHHYNGFPIHIEDLYQAELNIFGFEHDGTRIAPCDYFETHTHPILDFISGLFYITWVPFPIAFTLWAFFKGRAKLVFNFWLAFLIANLLGFIGYIVYPAAPPWYFLEYGAQLNISLPNGTAGLGRFDEMVGIPVYKSMYAGGTNTFGAMPSMHAAFPLILVYFSRKVNKKFLTLLFVLSLIAIWFGAVYSNHHYVIDVIMGIICGILGIFTTELYLNRKFAPAWFKSAVKYINPRNNFYA